MGLCFVFSIEKTSRQLNPAAFAGEIDHNTELMLIGASVAAGVLGIVFAYVQYFPWRTPGCGRGAALGSGELGVPQVLH